MTDGGDGGREVRREGRREGGRAYLLLDADAVADDAERAIFVRP